MTASNQATPSVRGKPFVKGDPRIRRNLNGNLCAEAAAWGINAKNALAKKLPPDVWAAVVAKKAKAGIPWAVQIYRETFVETAPQKHEVSGVLTFAFGENGNGEAHG
jgi:hypothetical protein